ncbi:unnamed protein product [Allacma fusca]|uniref:Cytochrome P450 n=1 Tax=Allacma fusca TaxID=39272 RepID=A0A8J2LCA5_9HEXA|nr:unnamed protein product [Allacma fusca]
MGLPILGYLPFLGQTPAIKLAELSKKYGDLFTLKMGHQLVLFVNDVENMKEMGRMDNFLGRIQLDIMKDYRQFCGLSYLEKEGWTEWRRFTLKTLKKVGLGQISMENLILAQVQEFCNFLSSHQNCPLYLQESIEIATLNSLWCILTGEKYELDDPEKKEILKTITAGITDQNLIGIVVFLPWLGKIFPKMTGWAKAVKCLESPIQMAKNIVEKHKVKYSQGYETDFIDLALTKIYATTDPNSHFYQELGTKHLLYTILDLFFTGSDAISIPFLAAQPNCFSINFYAQPAFPSISHEDPAQTRWENENTGNEIGKPFCFAKIS